MQHDQAVENYVCAGKANNIKEALGGGWSCHDES